MTDLINELMQNTNIGNRYKDGDYIADDGLLYCGRCQTKKQTEVVVLGKTIKPYCNCICEEEKLIKQEAEKKQQEKEDRIKELRKIGFSDSAMHNWTFANDDMSNKPLTKAMQNYCDNFAELKKAGKGLLLYGTVGTGKTYAACEVANALIDKGYRVLVTNFSKVLNNLQSTYEKQDYIDELNSFSLLVIDDLGIERNTEYAKEQVYNIIDARYRAGLPMIITTNLTMDKLKKPTDVDNARIYDRILEKCFPIDVSGESKRRAIIRDGYFAMKKLLGLGE